MSRTTAFFIFTLFTYFCIVTATDVNVCGDPDAIKSVGISNCESAPCIFNIGKTVEFTQKFVTKKNHDGIKTFVTAKLYGTELPFVGVDNADACVNIYDKDKNKVSCPLNAGQEYFYIKHVSISPFYIVASNRIIPVTWKLGDSNTKEDITCFQTNVKIKAF